MTRGNSFEVDKGVFERAKARSGVTKPSYYVTDEDMKKLFSEAELIGYGVYGCVVRKEGDKYMVHYSLGSSCD